MKKKNPMIVIAAVIEKDGCILIAKRKQGWHEAGKWEFPGGTLEEGETPEQCLKRELQEELDIITEVGDLMCISEYRYTPIVDYQATNLSRSGDLGSFQSERP